MTYWDFNSYDIIFLPVQIDRGVITDIAEKKIDPDDEDISLVKIYGCSETPDEIPYVHTSFVETNLTAYPEITVCDAPDPLTDTNTTGLLCREDPRFSVDDQFQVAEDICYDNATDTYSICTKVYQMVTELRFNQADKKCKFYYITLPNECQ